MKALRTLLAGAAAAAAFSLAAFAGPQYVDKDGRANSGFDVVAYFTQGQAVKGDAGFEADYNGAKWLFASAENRDAFLADPAKYAPLYDGHCAYAAGKGKGQKVRVDPYAFTIVDGKLYLNFNESIQRTWEKKQADYIAKANENWPALVDKPAADPGRKSY